MICLSCTGDDNTGRVVIWNLKAVLKDLNDDSTPKLLCQLDHHSGMYFTSFKINYQSYFLYINYSMRELCSME